jgi:TP901 family phage tail tape measure protein
VYLTVRKDLGACRFSYLFVRFFIYLQVIFMAGFVLSAEVRLSGPTNVRPVINAIQKQLSGVTATVNLQVPKNLNLNQLTNQLQTLNNAITKVGTNKGATTGINNVGKAIQGVAKQSTQAKTAAFEFGEAIGQAARKFTAFSVAAGALVGVVRSIQDGTDAAIKFQHEMVRLEQVGGDLGNSIGGISKEITKLSTSLGAPSNQLAKVAVTLRQAGLSAEDTRVALRGLAESSIAPTFGDINKTVEGAIAALQQFNLKAKDLYGILGSVNRVSADFAVESDDIVQAIQRSGGAFKAAGGNLNELIALFTSVRSTTRESAETIASGFNTIFSRLQRPQTVEQLKEMGVQLRYTADEAKAFGKTEADFVGPYEAVRRLNQALQNVPPASPEYAAIVEAIGGFRQVSKVIPLIQQFGSAEKALTSALSGQQSLAQSTAIAQKSLANQLAQLHEEFLDLFRTLGNNTTLQAYANIFLVLAKGAVAFAKALEPLIPLLSTLVLAKAFTTTGFLFNKQFGAGLKKGFSQNKAFARGGVVPGVGNTDSVHAALMPGEFVVRKSAAKAVGYDKLARMNKFGTGSSGPVSLTEAQKKEFLTHEEKQIYLPRHVLDEILEKGDAANIPPEFAEAVKKSSGLSANIKKKVAGTKEFLAKTLESHELRVPLLGEPPIGIVGHGTPGAAGRDTIVKRTVPQLRADTLNETLAHLLEKAKYNDIYAVMDKYVVNRGISHGFKTDISDPTHAYIDKLAEAKFGGPFELDNHEQKTINGVLFENFLHKIIDPLLSKKTKDASGKLAGFDFGHGVKEGNALNDAVFPSPVKPNSILDSKNDISSPAAGGSVISKSLNAAAEKVKALVEARVHKNAGGGYFGTDTVPAMLTPGEFVMNKGAAQRIGYGALSKMNRYADGGTVLGIQNAAIKPGTFPIASGLYEENPNRPRYSLPIPPNMVNGGTDDKILAVLRQILAAIRSGKGVGGAGAGVGAAAAAAGATDPKGGFGARFGKFGTIAAVLGSQYLPQIAESFAGTPEKPGRGGVLGIQATQGVTQAVAGGTTGAAVGALFGPWGAALGGAVGALHGFYLGVTDVNKRIRDLTLDNDLKRFGGVIQKITADASDINLSDASHARHGLQTILKGADASGDRNQFFAEKVNFSELSALGNKLATVANVRTKDTHDEVVSKLLGSGGGLGKDLLSVLREAPENRDKTISQILKPLEQLATRQASDREREADLKRLQSQTENQTRSFARFGTALDSAGHRLEQFSGSLDTILSITEGKFSSGSVSKFSKGAAAFGTGAVSSQEFGSVIDFITGPLEGLGGQLSKDFSQTAKGVHGVLSRLPEILSQVGKGGLEGDLGTSFEKAISQEAPGTSRAISNALKEAFSTFDMKDVFGKLNTDIGGLADELEKRAFPRLSQVISNSAKTLEDSFNSFSTNLARLRDLQDKVGESQDKIVSLQVGAEQTTRQIIARRSGLVTHDRTPLGVLGAPFQAQQQRLTGFRGLDATDPSVIGNRLETTVSKIATATRQRNELLNKGNFRGGEAVEKNLSTLGSAANHLQTALQRLADPVERNAALQERLNQLNEEEAQRISIAEKYLTASPADRFQLDTTANVGSAIAGGQANIEDFAPEMKQAVLQLSHDLNDTITPIFNNLSGREFRENLLKNSPVTARIANLPSGAAAERNQIENQVITNVRDAVVAQGKLTEFLRTRQDSFFTNLEANQARFLSDFQRTAISAQLSDIKIQEGSAKAGTDIAQNKVAAGRNLEGLGFKNFSNLPGLAGDLGREGGIQELLARQTLGQNAKADAAKNIGKLTLADSQTGGVSVKALLSKIDISAKEIDQVIELLRSAPPRGGKTEAESVVAFNSQLLGAVQQVISDRQFETGRTINKEVGVLGKKYNVDPKAVLAAAQQPDVFQKNVKEIAGAPDLKSLEDQAGAAGDKLKSFGSVVDELSQKLIRFDAGHPQSNPAQDLINRALSALGVTGTVAAKAAGGSIFAARGTDTVPAMLTPGEFVVNAKSARTHKDLLKSINNARGSMYFDDGGFVPRRTPFTKEELQKLKEEEAAKRAENILNVSKNLEERGQFADASDLVGRLAPSRLGDVTGGQNAPREGQQFFAAAKASGAGAFAPRTGLDFDTLKNTADTIAAQAQASGDSKGLQSALRFYQRAAKAAPSPGDQGNIQDTITKIDPYGKIADASLAAQAAPAAVTAPNRQVGISRRLSTRLSQIDSVLGATSNTQGDAFTTRNLQQGAYIHGYLNQEIEKRQRAANGNVNDPTLQALQGKLEQFKGSALGGTLQKEQELRAQKGLGELLPPGYYRDKTTGQFKPIPSFNRRSPLKSRFMSLELAERQRQQNATQPLTNLDPTDLANVNVQKQGSVEDDVSQRLNQFRQFRKGKSRNRGTFVSNAPQYTINKPKQQQQEAQVQPQQGGYRRRIMISGAPGALGALLGLGHHQRFAAGGMARGTDVVPAMLTPGEFIVSAGAARAHKSTLEAINRSGGRPVYRAAGGAINEANGSAGGSFADAANSLVGPLNGFSQAAESMNGVVAGFQQLIGPLNLFSQNIQLMKAPFDAFNVAATNLGVGLSLFNNQAAGLTAALNNLANIPKTITVQGSTNVTVAVTGAEAFKAMSDQILTEVKQQAIAQLKPEIIADLKGGNVLA